jgi:hypothetical protein
MMTGVAMYFDVRAVEFVISLSIVIEAPNPPAVGVVAAGTIDPQGELVYIVLLVASITSE